MWLESVGGAAEYYRKYRKKRKRGQIGGKSANRDAMRVKIEVISDRYP